MGDPTQPLLRFVNQGVFPFIGRKKESLHIQQFLSKIGDADSMQVLLLQGEAGIGKTRLLDESLPLFLENDVTIIRAKFHNGTHCSSILVLADALRHSDTVRRIIKAESSSSLDFVISSLIKIAKVRRLIVVLEDIHLLSELALQEFAQIISALSDEPIGLLCASRMLNSTIRGVIEPYIVDEILLRGWSKNEVSELWHELLSEELIDLDFLEQFQKNTDGNPLMIRMALHSGVRDRITGKGNSNNIDMLPINTYKIEQAVARSSQMFTSGLTAHLNAREYASAEQIAIAGEIFSKEAALIILDNNDEALSELIAKGIIIQSLNHAESLNSFKSASLPFIFTHSLLHKHFALSNRFDINKFWKILATNAPLYSCLPYEYIPSHIQCIETDTDMFIKGLKSLSTLMRDTVRSHKSQLHDAMITAYDAAVIIARERLTGDELLQVELDRLHLKISILRYNGLHDTEERRLEHRELLNSYILKTQHLSQEEFTYHRLYALAWQFAFQAFTFCKVDFGIWNEIKSLVKRYSYLTFQISSIEVLSWALNYMTWIRRRVNSYQDFYGEMDWIVDHVESLTNTKNPILKKYIVLRIYPLLLVLCRNDEELAKNRSKLSIIVGQDVDSDSRASTKILNFHIQYSSAETALEIVRNYQKSQIHTRIDFGTYFDYFNLLMAVNTPIDVIKEWLVNVATHFPAKDYPELWSNLLCASNSTLLLRGEQQMESFFNEIAKSVLSPSKDAQGLLIAWLVGGCHVDAITEVKYVHKEILESGYAYWLDDSCWLQNGGGLLAYIRSLVENSTLENASELQEGLHSFLNLTTSNSNRFTDLLSLLIWLRYAALSRIDNYQLLLRPQIRSAIFRTMDWLIESKRIVFACIFPRYFPEYFDEPEIPLWSKRITHELEDQYQRLHYNETNSATPLSLSIVGKVSFQYSGTDEHQTIKGSRLKCILGLMALDLTLTKPLTRQEFFDVVAGEEQDDETKRNTVKVAVYQLRKLLGKDSIIQGKHAPRLNLDYCKIDYIDVWKALLKAEKDVANNKLYNARNKLLYVLRTMNGNVLFPTLYETIFETAREEFETRLRRLILRVCRSIIQVGDSSSCELILQLADHQLSGDQEINDLLVDVLHGQHKFTEAFRVKFAATAA
ncbi:MAG: ATP-binding protein [Ignavibacteria bacterium]|nr:ATP-binding protein [Ignavibacteria bacterium]